jgi:hypothetical protein
MISAYYQIGDNWGERNLVPAKSIIKYFQTSAKGYKGMLGMEHGNALEGR